ncbi:protein kinase domain-containing protein [Haliangium sp.]|uniref:serine/threonine-protein kinase n=1 Tax=Haliangium sp. TaxID=2663208 RepID=UPI003D0FA729
MSIREGQVFGSYQVSSRLGTGGMGAVYLAEHPIIGKRVALKIIHQDLSANREVISRFFNEARAVNQIGNEHIVEIHDVGQSPDGEYYFVMEYIHGCTLSALLLQEGALVVDRALHIGAQIADALAAAHAAAIVHRDLKPDNIMLTTRLGDHDFVKVLDFGLAKMMAEAGQVNLTAQGVVLGTPHYMAPEACEGKRDIDHRVDIYALGVLLFQMTTGQVPFDAAYMGGILVKHVTEPPPAPRALNPTIPPAVEQIILRCLAKDPGARFGSMAELRRALLDPDAYLASGPPVVPSAAPTLISARAPVPPAMLRPAPPQNLTMPIGTPVGYRSSARRRWPMLVTVLSLAALTGAATVLVLTEDEPAAPAASYDAGPAATEPGPSHVEDPAAPAGVDVPDPGAVGAAAASGRDDERDDGRDGGPLTATGAAAVVTGGDPSDPAGGDPAAAADGDAGPAPAQTVVVRLSTVPDGAEVFDLAGALLGTTPTTIELPRDGREHVLLFRHPAARERRTTVTAAGDTEISIELEPLARQPPRGGKKPRRKRPAPGALDLPSRLPSRF